MPQPRASERAAELIREGATLVLRAPPELFEQVDAASLAEHDPAVAADPVLVAGLRRANRATIAHWARSNVADPGGEVTAFVGPETLGLARDLVRRGFDARALEPYRAGQNAAWQLWMEIAFSLTDDPAELHELLRASARSIFAYVDATNAATVERIGCEREELTRGTNAERLETVTLVLEQTPLDLDRAARRLGYDFARTHVAGVVWTTEPDVDDGALERAAEAFGVAAGGQRPLTVLASSAALWAWVAAPSGPDEAALEVALADLPGVRIAVGSCAAGVDGFRRSHADALAAQRLVERLGSSPRAASYESVRVVSLVVQDEQRAQAFVDDTLGELAGAAPTLRETLRTYLHLQSNATRAAAALFAHRNTVVTRLAKAEALLPRPLADSAFEVAVALEVLHWRG